MSFRILHLQKTMTKEKSVNEFVSFYDVRTFALDAKDLAEERRKGWHLI